MVIGWQPWFIRPYATGMTDFLLLYCCNYIGNQFIIAIRHLRGLWYIANILCWESVTRGRTMKVYFVRTFDELRSVGALSGLWLQLQVLCTYRYSHRHHNTFKQTSVSLLLHSPPNQQSRHHTIHIFSTCIVQKYKQTNRCVIDIKSTVQVDDLQKLGEVQIGQIESGHVKSRWFWVCT
jgi:hypothetical protein